MCERGVGSGSMLLNHARERCPRWPATLRADITTSSLGSRWSTRKIEELGLAVGLFDRSLEIFCKQISEWRNVLLIRMISASQCVNSVEDKCIRSIKSSALGEGGKHEGAGMAT